MRFDTIEQLKKRAGRSSAIAGGGGQKFGRGISIEWTYNSNAIEGSWPRSSIFVLCTYILLRKETDGRHGC
ncbi:hypothetical protein HMSSN036_18040 [Paenibacillus macerans]|nr:hypothetical protein HMSSN036_18040 [Paenibacillus macerans]